MSARRNKNSTKIRNAKLRKAFLEGLESRLLFNTIITDTDPLTATPATETFEYKDAKGNTVRISVSGDVSAEFIFGRMTKGDKESGAGGNQLILGDAVSPTTVEKGKTVATTEDGRDLFHVYVAQASIDSFISIAQVPVFSAENRPMTPFVGNVTLTVTPNRGNDVGKATATNTGAIYLALRTRETAAEIENEADRPVRTAVFNGQGLLAVTPNNRLVAGITTAEGVSIGRFLFGGAVSGEVRFLGSIETFYCGALLTGTTEGQFEGTPLDPGNFFVQGDIRNVLVKGSIGTELLPKTLLGRAQPTYVTGVDFDIRGRVGQIRSGADYLAYAKVSNTNPGLGLRTRQQEVEIKAITGVNRGNFSEFEIGDFGDFETFFYNDTFETAQFLGSINSKQLGNNSVQLNGVLQSLVNVNDVSDYYAVPLMAGQQVTVRLLAPNVSTTFQLINGNLVEVTEETTTILHVGVFDPDKRLIATDYAPGSTDNTSGASNPLADPDPAHQQPFTFVADRPGIYRFAVAHDAPAFGTTGDRLGEYSYQLQITGVGNMAIGGLVAQSTICAPVPLSFVGNGGSQLRANIETVLGDLGAIYSIGDAIVSPGGQGFNAVSQGGDVRAFDAQSIGTVEGSASANGDETLTYGGTGGTVLAYTGSVGMIRAAGTDRGNTVTRINENAQQRGLPNIGGDVQYVIAPNTLWTDIAANGSIGVVQTAQFGTIFHAGSMTANADGVGKPSAIDLIDVTRDLGTLGAGGPVISAGPGGNVRYIHIASGSTAYRPVLFGGSQPEETTYVRGQDAEITDDSGAQIRITPTQEDLLDPLTGQPLLDPVTFEPLSNSGTLTVLTYPIARASGGAGVAVIRVTSTRGLTVRTNGGTAEFGEIVSTGSGPALIVDPGADLIPNTADDEPGPDGLLNSGDEPFAVDPTSTNDNSLILRGKRTDVYAITGNNFNVIRNLTEGEIVKATIGQVGTLEAQNLGLAKSSLRSGMLTHGSAVADITGTAEVEGNVFPYLDTHNAIVIRGASQSGFAAAEIFAREAIANLMILGVAQEIKANSDSAGVKGVYEGIVGAIFAKGQLRFVSVGEGLMPSGSGNMGRAGIYCIADRDLAISNSGIGRIERVVNTGAGSDLRGNIVSNTGIGSIEVSGGGSIINATYGILSVAEDPTGVRTGADLAPSSAFSGTAIIVQGTDAAGRALGNIDRISVNGNGGIIGLLARTNNLGTVSSVGGFGIINCFFTTLGNGRFGSVVADGYGARGVFWRGGQSLESLTILGDGRRLTTTSFSESVRFSENLAFDPFFGTKPNPLTDLHVVIGTTKATPQRKGTSASGSLDLSEIRVSRDLGPVTANTIRATVFNIANNASSIVTRDYVDSLLLNAGRVDTLTIGKDALRSTIEVAGPVGNVYVGGSFRGSSHLFARGENGSISSFTTGRSHYGDVYAQKSIGTIRVGTVYGSQGTRTAGGMTSFITNGDVVTGAVLTVEKNLGKLVIGEDLEDGALIRLGTLGTKTIIGDEIGVVDLKPWEA